MRILRPTVVALAGALALAGCGSKAGGDTNAPNNNSAAYDAAYDICAGGTKATADAYAVEATKEAVTQLVVEQVSGGTPQDEKSAREGCRAALAKADGR